MKLFKLTGRDFKLSLFLLVIGIVTRLPLIEKFQSHWDASLFSIAILHYSIQENTPPTPGHPLYIAFGRLFYFFVNDPHFAILLVSVLFSGLSAAAIYIGGKVIYNSTTGLIAALIFLSGSTFYYFGITPYSFVLLPFFWYLLTASIYLLIFKRKDTALWIGFFYAFGIGVRPQDSLFLTPLVLYAFFVMKKQEKIKFIVSFAVAFLIWMLPLMQLEGGGLNYPKMLLAHTIPYSIGYHPQDLELMFKDYFLSFGIAGLFLLYYLRFYKKLFNKKYRKNVIFYTLWILPNLIFNLAISSVHAGYQMDYLLALLLLVSFAIYKLLHKKKIVLFLVISLIVVTNLLIFFWNRDPKFIKPYRPSSFHYTDIRKNDIKLGSKVNYINAHYNPKSTLIITTSTLWSPYMYHLKNYHQDSIEALFTSNKQFSNQRRDSFNWKVKEYMQKSRILIIPSGINKIILTDDEFEISLSKLNSTKHLLPGNSYLIEIPVSTGEKILYGYHFLKRIY